MERLFISQPVMGQQERTYVDDCIVQNQLTWSGPYVKQFEREFAGVCGTTYALTCCNGTSALHLALLALGVKWGDEVIVPTLTYIACANAVTYCGAKPVFVDVDEHTWDLTADTVLSAVSRRTKAVIAVHLFGNPPEMQKLRRALPSNVRIIEDAAQAHGVRVCDFSDVATFSFYGNKIITTGEGGAVVTNNPAISESVQFYRGQAQSAKRYWHSAIGYNYRMTNVQAAIGVAQLHNLSALQQTREMVWKRYCTRLGSKVYQVQCDCKEQQRAYWMMSPLFFSEEQRDKVQNALEYENIETRPMFPPLHMQRPYAAGMLKLPVAEEIFKTGLSIPTHSAMTLTDVDRVCDVIVRSL